MHVHHLNCISTCPMGGKLMDGRSRTLVKRGHLTCHCLLLELDDRLILVDTGLGLRDVADPKSRLSQLFLTMVSPDFREEMTAYGQIQRLGLQPGDISDIILTHLDFDHAGGLDDFPGAKVHMLQQERDYALEQKTWLDRQRFRPQQWSTQDNWRVYSPGKGETWFGFEQVHQLDDLPPNIALIPLPGHTYGHAGVAIKLRDKWLLQAGDAYFYHREMDLDAPSCTTGLRMYQTLMEKDRQARLHNQQRLRQLRRSDGDQVEIFCSHDLVEFERLSGRSAKVPADRLSP